MKLRNHPKAEKSESVELTQDEVVLWIHRDQLRRLVYRSLAMNEGAARMCRRLVTAINEGNPAAFRQELIEGLRSIWELDARAIIDAFDTGNLQEWYSEAGVTPSFIRGIATAELQEGGAA